MQEFWEPFIEKQRQKTSYDLFGTFKPKEYYPQVGQAALSSLGVASGINMI